MRRALALCALFPLLGCAELPTISSNECGNAVVEPGEDCDTFAPNSESSCRPRGAPGQCHLDCARRNDGTRPSCPSGWGCDGNAICRAPSGQFEAPGSQVAAGAWSLGTGDFDGDGRADLISHEPLDVISATRVSFHYFDNDGALARSVLFPKLLLGPSVADLNHDGKSDLAFSDGRIGLMLGRTDRTWAPETFSTYQVSDPNVRMLGLYTEPVDHVSALVAFATLSGFTGIYLPNPVSGVLEPRATISVPTAELVGDPVSGDVIEDSATAPCWEAVWAARGANTFSLANPCIANGNGDRSWREQFEQSEIALEPPAAIDVAPLLADLNGDGHLDVLVGAGGIPYVSYGDGSSLGRAVPFVLTIANPDILPSALPMPLAAGDFTGDGVVDFVLDQYLLVSMPTPGSSLPSYVPDHVNRLAAPWTLAKIADLNHDGNLDVTVASSGSLNIELFIGNGTPHLIETPLSTGGRVKRLDVGDFDGDLSNDLVFVEQGIGGDRDALRIAFGPLTNALAGEPSPALTIARVRDSQQLAVYRESAFGNMVVTSSEVVDGVPTGLLTLLDGAGDRIPFAPVALTSFSSTGSVEYAVSLGLSAGAFRAPGSADVLAVATVNLVDLELWLGAGVDSELVAPTRLSGLDPRLSPVRPSGIDFSSNISSAAADIDGDGREEAIFVMPAGQDQAQCGVLVVAAGRDPAALPAAREPVILDAACPDPEPALLDVDADGFLDLVLMSGSANAADRQLWVLWNDGAGGFSASSLSTLPEGGTTLRAFSALPPSPGTPFRFAYLASDAVELVSSPQGSRSFDAPRTLALLPDATGIAAADVNGDGVVDLALAASGKLSIMKAQLSPL